MDTQKATGMVLEWAATCARVAVLKALANKRPSSWEGRVGDEFTEMWLDEPTGPDADRIRKAFEVLSREES